MRNFVSNGIFFKKTSTLHLRSCGKAKTYVTLVSEDNQKVEAHRIIIAACSSVLQIILKKSMHNHPMIYMRGLKAEHLLDIVDFMSQGATSVYQEDLDGFLALAEELQLKGLSGAKDECESTQKSASVNDIQPTKTDRQLKAHRQMKSQTNTIKRENVALFDARD